MKIKLISTQIYDEHEEKFEREYENAEILLKDQIVVKYENDEICYEKDKNLVEVKSAGNNIIIELNKEKVLNYNTPYGIINLKTFGEKIFISENPFKFIIEYKLKMNETMEYKNIVEVCQIMN